MRIALPIGVKLISLIAALLVISIVSLVWLSTKLFIEDNTALIQQMNSDTATGLATQMQELFKNTTDKVRIAGKTLVEGQKANRAVQKIDFIDEDADFLAVYLVTLDGSGQLKLVARSITTELKELDDADGDKAYASLISDKDFSGSQVLQGEAQVTTLVIGESTALAVSVPFIKVGEGFTHMLTAVLRQERFAKIFAESDIITSFMVDSRGKLLAHKDAARVSAGENVSHLEVVKKLLEGKFHNGQTRYVDTQSKEARLGAFNTVGFAGLGVVSEVAEEKAFEAAKRIQYRAVLFGIIVLSLAFLVGYLYSGTITWPIKQLVGAVHQIEKGDFAINLKPRSKDELGKLSLAVNVMAKGLEERDKVKATFNKFHSKEIAEKLLSGEVKLGGDRLDATIFFSDVRGFTAMSEIMEPEAVVEMLNEYMTRMVAIITRNKGVVDKYIGDAIMALWGVPLKGENDTFNAVKACIEMRIEMQKFNDERIAKGLPALKIGMGLNKGLVIAGNIGSDQKMEYTVIGDTVNLASRMESMTKQNGTDFLIPESVYEVVKDKYIFDEIEPLKVKGKSSAIRAFKVKGYISETGEQVIVETEYSSYASEKSDKAA